MSGISSALHAQLKVTAIFRSAVSTEYIGKSLLPKPYATDCVKKIAVSARTRNIAAQIHPLRISPSYFSILSLIKNTSAMRYAYKK